jgi:nucleoside-diphosphate-sugar epimerase
MKNIIIFGASGFIGLNLLKKLTDCRVIAVVRDPKKILKYKDRFKINNLNLEIIQINSFLDYQELSQVSRIFDNHSIIINLAWDVTPGVYTESPDNYLWAKATMWLGDMAKENKCKHFIGIGTCAEYKSLERPLHSTSKIFPKTLYALSKALTRDYLFNIFKDSPTVFTWCRAFYIFGDDERPGRLVSDIKIAIKKKESVKLTDGSQTRDYINVSTVAKKLLLVIEDTISGDKNLCSGVGKSLKSFLLEDIVSEDNHHLLKFGERDRNNFDPNFIVGVDDLPLINVVK